MRKSVLFLFIFMLIAILSGCILSKSPTTDDVTMNLGDPMTFSVNVFPNSATYTWTLDSLPLSNTEKSYVYTAEAGDHTLVVKAKHFLGTDTQTWTIKVKISTLYFSPASQTVTAGQDFILDAYIDPVGDSVVVGEFHISYDQSKFSLKSITVSPTFSTLLYAPPIPSPEDGLARIACAVPLTGAPVTSSSKIATFSFQAKVPVNSSEIIFTTESGVGAEGKDGNIPMDLKSALVTVLP